MIIHPQLFDFCLAPDTMGDGTGCDNMTAVIVQFRKKGEAEEQKSPEKKAEEGDSSSSKNAALKRPAEEETPDKEAKNPAKKPCV